MGGEANSKMSDVRVNAILRALEMGCTRRAAAGAADIHHATFYRWIDNDATLRDAVEKAEQKAEAAFTAAVANAVPKNWQAAAWWLERRHHMDYGRREHVTVDLSALVRTVADELGVPEAEAIAEAERILAGTR